MTSGSALIPFSPSGAGPRRQRRASDERTNGRWRRAWRDFVTAGGRISEDDPDYLRAALLNLLAASALCVCALILVLEGVGFLALPAARVAVNVVGVAAGAAVIAGLRAGVSLHLCAHVANAVLFVALLVLALIRGDQPLAALQTVLYPPIAFLLLDSVRGGVLCTVLMTVAANAIVATRPGMDGAPWPVLLEAVISMTSGMFLVGAAMALYLHSRQRVMAQLRALSEQLDAAASHDPLTGLLNRRTFTDMLDRELGRRGQDARLLALLLFDVDRFKSFNDRFGHPAGDRLLTRIAAATQEVFGRREDMIYRLGGEEFGVVFHADDAAQAGRMADRLLAAVEGLGEPAPAGPRDRVTASAGLSLVAADGRDAGQVYREADEALYRAKSGGRARWIMTRA